MNKGRVLAVDDELDLLEALTAFIGRDYEVATVRSPKRALETIPDFDPDVVISDMKMPGMDGFQFIQEIEKIDKDIPVIILSGFGDKDALRKAIKFHAFDFLDKPFDKSLLIESVDKAIQYRRFREEQTRLLENLLTAKRDLEKRTKELDNHYNDSEFSTSVNDNKIECCFDFTPIKTKNSDMKTALQYVESMAKTSLPVLVTGETGCGKELIAQAIHKASERRGEYVITNVAGLDDALFSDTLFGHTPGAFTNANSSREGLVERARGGTLFLDEIGDLSPQSQVKLLRLLESGEYYPLGSDKVKKTDARIVVATHQNIKILVDKGAFRKDLFFRLEAHHVQIPPLRNRNEDLEELVHQFVEEAAHQLGKRPPSLTKELFQLLRAYNFPGNVRELRGMVFDAISQHKSGSLSSRVFKDKMQTMDAAPAEDGKMMHLDFSQVVNLPNIKEVENLLIEEALRRSDGNQAVAAQLLGMSRQALNKRINRGGLKVAS